MTGRPICVFAVICLVVILAILYASKVLFLPENEIQVAIKESTCKLPVLDPWDKSILKAVERKPLPWCKWTPHLTYVTGDWLKVNLTLAKEKYKISKCEYQIIPYHNVKQDDTPIEIVIESGVKLSHDFTRVSCYGDDKNKSLIYRNYHVLTSNRNTTVKEFKKAGSKDSKDKPWNVILMVTDSMSRSAGVRYLPETHKYLMNHLNATEMLGYTKVGLNTFPNMIALFTGKHIEEETTLPHDGPFDPYPLVFKNFSAAGYKTMFSDEAGPYGSIFYYLKRGLNKAVTDYYFKPIGEAIRQDKHISVTKGCEELLLQYRMLLEYIAKFTDKYHKQEPFFGFTYNYMLSHDRQYDSRHLDQVYYEFLVSLDKKGIFEDTAVFFFGDHGARTGMLANTDIGVLENKLPMMHVVLPRKLREKYPQFVKNLKVNSQRITTVFDVRQTLLDIIALKDNKRQPRSGHGISLLSEVPKDRTCISAAIPLIFCACYHEHPISLNTSLVRQGAAFLTEEINNILKESSELCAKLDLHNVTSAVAFNAKDDFMAYRLRWFTKPGFAHFEGTLMFRQQSIADKKKTGSGWTPRFTREGPLGRLNVYGKQSICVKNPVHQIYCFCKDQVKVR